MPSFNVQSIVEPENKLIVELTPTQAPVDCLAMVPVLKRFKEEIHLNEMTVIADAGYQSSEKMKECKDDKIEIIVPLQAKKGHHKHPVVSLSKEKFKYNLKEDIYECPMKGTLVFRNQVTRDKKVYRRYVCESGATCPIRDLCRKKGKREILRWKHEDVFEISQKRNEEDPLLMLTRKSTVEHPFGTIKYNRNCYYFLLRGLKKVQAECSLIAIAYNIKRLASIYGNFTEYAELLKEAIVQLLIFFSLFLEKRRALFTKTSVITTV